VIAVLDYGIGNLRSAQKALELSAGPGQVRLVSTATDAQGASGVVLPGVGAFGRCMEALSRSGLDAVARRAIEDGVPFLGVCIGMQLLYEGSDEDPGVAGLGILRGRVKRLTAGVKHPQMQWNKLVVSRPACRLLAGVADGAWVYFVHSYAPELSDDVVATCDYGGAVVAMVERESLWATQFHPEKSSAVGLSILANFVAVCGDAA
jgi:imidazole glycerol-phosphate synthase subunit HisH